MATAVSIKHQLLSFLKYGRKTPDEIRDGNKDLTPLQIRNNLYVLSSSGDVAPVRDNITNLLHYEIRGKGLDFLEKHGVVQPQKEEQQQSIRPYEPKPITEGAELASAKEQETSSVPPAPPAPKKVVVQQDPPNTLAHHTHVALSPSAHTHVALSPSAQPSVSFPSCSPDETPEQKIARLVGELATAQSRIAQLESERLDEPPYNVKYACLVDDNCMELFENEDKAKAKAEEAIMANNKSIGVLKVHVVAVLATAELSVQWK